MKKDPVFISAPSTGTAKVLMSVLGAPSPIGEGKVVEVSAVPKWVPMDCCWTAAAMLNVFSQGGCQLG